MKVMDAILLSTKHPFPSPSMKSGFLFSAYCLQYTDVRAFPNPLPCSAAHLFNLKGLILRAFYRRRNALREVVDIDPELSINRFRRVLALGCTQAFITAPCTLYIFVINVSRMFPWTGLANAHLGFSAIWQVPKSSTTRQGFINDEWDEWVTPFTALVFFLFFGVSRAMWLDYWKGVVSLLASLGWKRNMNAPKRRPISQHQEPAPTMIFHVRTTQLSSAADRYIFGYINWSFYFRSHHDLQLHR